MASIAPGDSSTGYKLIPSDSLELPPPDYDDVVNNSSPIPGVGSDQPTAPPLSELELAAAENPSPPQHLVAAAGRGGSGGGGRSSTDYGGTRASRSRQRHAAVNQPSTSYKHLNAYISYSIPSKLRKYSNPPFPDEDPELDVEAQFASHVVREAQKRIEKKRRLQCVSGWLWCFGVMLVMALIVLPIGMIVVGIAGADECSFRSNTIIIYLLLGGVLMATLVLSRIIPSSLTCCKNRNICDTKTSVCCAGCICAVELVFFTILALSLVTLFLGSYWIFREKPQTCSASVSSDCCASYVYVCGAIFNVLQYVVYVLCALYTLITVACVRGMHNVMTGMGH